MQAVVPEMTISTNAPTSTVIFAKTPRLLRRPSKSRISRQLSDMAFTEIFKFQSTPTVQFGQADHA